MLQIQPLLAFVLSVTTKYVDLVGSVQIADKIQGEVLQSADKGKAKLLGRFLCHR